MKKVTIAINGFGRIGRAFFRMAYGRPDMEIVAVNDLGDIANLSYLLMYDTVYGRFQGTVETKDHEFIVDGKPVKFFSEKDPLKLPWKDLGIDIVIESTGFFTSYEKAKVHLDAGAKHVVISAPVKEGAEGENLGATVLMCVNEEKLDGVHITSNASCTTNAASPLIGILKESIGIEKALLSTVHAYTASQAIVDGPKGKDFREGRAAAQNIVPTSTGAAIATALAHTELVGKFDGISLRVPVPVGSIVDITFIASRNTSAEEVNALLAQASEDPRWKEIFAVTDDPIVSSDIIGAQYASIADLSFTRVVGGNLVKVLAWYDNESSYTHTLVMHTAKVAEKL